MHSEALDESDNVVRLKRLPDISEERPIECESCDIIRLLHREIDRSLQEVQKMFTHKLKNAQIATLGQIDLLQYEIKALTDALPEQIDKAAQKGGESAIKKLDVDMRQLKEMIEKYVEKKETKKTIKANIVSKVIDKGFDLSLLIVVLGIGALFFKLKEVI
jgi:hypothetical protein